MNVQRNTEKWNKERRLRLKLKAAKGKIPPYGPWGMDRTERKVTPHHKISRKVSAARKTHCTVCTGNKEEGLNKNFSSTE